jgi:hypothetical protein
MNTDPLFVNRETESTDDLKTDFGEISKELEIPQRTQRPPPEELITRLNQLASKPPFCYIYKLNKKDPE